MNDSSDADDRWMRHAQTLAERAASEGEVRAFVSLAEDPEAGDAAAPLGGIAVGVKDIVDTADLPTEMGCPAIYGGWRRQVPLGSSTFPRATYAYQCADAVALGGPQLHGAFDRGARTLS